MPPPSLSLLLPFSSPIHTLLHPLPTSASRLRAPGRSISLSPCARPLASPSSSFALAAVNDDDDYDDDVVLGDCLVFEDEAFETPDLDRPSSRPSRNGGGSLVPERWKDAGGLEDIAELFNSSEYVPGETEDGKSVRSRRKLFTDEEKVLLNRRLPDLEAASSSKWLPLHTLAASGDFYLLDNLLKHKVDVNALDKDGLPAIHKAIISKKHAIINYLLRNSANPSGYDRDGATLMHYAVQTACNQTIKTLLLYNVDINRPDDYGWTPLHLAVQTQRTDIVRLLLLKGADRTLKNQDGLTPLELCLRLGHDVRTYELIKLLKNFRISKQRNSF